MAKRTFVSEKQKALLIDIMENDEELKKGKFTNTFTHKTAKDRWDSIAVQLNAIPGACKNGIMWRKTWQDLKKNIKKKNSERRQHTAGTGGGPPLPNMIFSSAEEKLMNILGETAVQGHPDITESIVEIVDSQDEVKIGDTEDQSTSFSLLKDANNVVVSEVADHNYSQKRILRKSNKRFSKGQIYDNSLEVSRKLAEAAERDQKTKQDYYERKLFMMDSHHTDKLQLKREKLEMERQKLEVERQKLVLLHKDIEVKQLIANSLHLLQSQFGSRYRLGGAPGHCTGEVGRELTNVFEDLRLIM